MLDFCLQQCSSFAVVDNGTISGTTLARFFMVYDFDLIHIKHTCTRSPLSCVYTVYSMGNFCTLYWCNNAMHVLRLKVKFILVKLTPYIIMPSGFKKCKPTMFFSYKTASSSLDYRIRWKYMREFIVKH